MKALIQRVASASVVVEVDCVAEINTGLLVLLGVIESDTQKEASSLASKVLNMRIFNDAEGKMNLSLLDVGGEALVVSQFTLYADARKGNRPSYIQAARPEIAEPLYKTFVAEMEKLMGKKVPTGIFGADMKVQLVNDGPVTIILETTGEKP
ncbi:MAG: D-tyrosyl-tRNA(Tyr) deacylase [Sphingomonadales bacterium]|nr:D-tyrosyl-tRNA(Tyr) deacylase [Sphingomonadales bacterium]